jgi:hypothetical protein
MACRVWFAGDALLLIKLVQAGRSMKPSKAFHMKARWVKVDRLDNWAIFVSADG